MKTKRTIIFSLFVLLSSLGISATAQPDNAGLIAFFTPSENEQSVYDLIILNPQTRSTVAVYEDIRTDPSVLSWSPTFDTLAFSTSTDEVLTVGLLNIDAEHISTPLPVEALPHEFSPDGRYLAYTTGSFISQPSVLSIATTYNDETLQLTSDLFNAYDAVWSPNGQTLALLGESTDYANLDDMYLTGSIFLLDLQDGELSRLTERGSLPTILSWSASGNRLAYVVGEPRETPNDIYTIVEGGIPQLITDMELRHGWPHWVLNDTHLLYSESDDENQRSRMMLYSFREREAEVLFEHDSIGGYVGLSPDRTQFAYIATTINGEEISSSELCVFDLETRDEWCAEQEPYFAGKVAWGW